MNISLVGFMGTGKTSVGKLLAKKLKMRYFDADAVIEEDAGMKISKIFEDFGEPYFRELEEKAIAKLSAQDGLVISCGGGAVLREANIVNLKRNGPVVCLMATPSIIYNRIKNEAHRPLLQVPDPKKRIRELLEKRAPLYAKADFTIDTSKLTIGKVVDKIAEYAKNFKRN